MGATLKNVFADGPNACAERAARRIPRSRCANWQAPSASSRRVKASAAQASSRHRFRRSRVDPPTLIVCVNRASSSWPILRERRSFGVNVLSASHRELAHRFAGRTGAEGAARYEGGHWIALRTGAPLLSDALAAFDCAVEEIIERHSHAIIIGRVEAVRRSGGGGALVYWRGDYDQLGWSPEEISNAIGLAPLR